MKPNHDGHRIIRFSASFVRFLGFTRVGLRIENTDRNGVGAPPVTHGFGEAVILIRAREGEQQIAKDVGRVLKAAGASAYPLALPQRCILSP